MYGGGSLFLTKSEVLHRFTEKLFTFAHVVTFKAEKYAKETVL